MLGLSISYIYMRYVYNTYTIRELKGKVNVLYVQNAWH